MNLSKVINPKIIRKILFHNEPHIQRTKKKKIFPHSKPRDQRNRILAVSETDLTSLSKKSDEPPQNNPKGEQVDPSKVRNVRAYKILKYSRDRDEPTPMTNGGHVNKLFVLAKVEDTCAKAHIAGLPLATRTWEDVDRVRFSIPPMYGNSIVCIFGKVGFESTRDPHGKNNRISSMCTYI